MNLPDMYARVCAVRPELAVEGLTYVPCYCGNCGLRWKMSKCAGSLAFPSDTIAAALILARWVEALPENYWLGHMNGNDRMPIRWQVCGITAQEIIESPNAPTPIEALAAFYLNTK